MESGAEQASLYTVLQEKKIGVGAAMMGSAHTYEVPLVNTSHHLPFLHSCSKQPSLCLVARLRLTKQPSLCLEARLQLSLF